MAEEGHGATGGRVEKIRIEFMKEGKTVKK